MSIQHADTKHDAADWQRPTDDLAKLVESSAVPVDDIDLPPLDAYGEDDAQPVVEPPESAPWDAPLNLSKLLGIKPAPIPFFIRDRIQLGRGHLLTGIGGSAKTRLLYQLAVGAVLGKMSWDWTVERTGRAVLVLTEDVADDVHRTLHAICEGLDLSDADRDAIGQRIIAYPLAGQDVRLLLKPDGRTLCKSHQFESLVERINAIGDVVLVGLDPALSLTDGDELDQGHQRMLGKAADDLAVRTGAAVVLISHATKASASSDELGSHNSRGGGAITDAVRAEYSMRTMTAKEAVRAGISDTEERKRHKQLVATKGNHIPPCAFAPIWLRSGEGGVLQQAEVRLDTDTSGPSDRDMDALNVLAELRRDHPPKLEEWRERCQEAGIISGKNPEAIRKAMERTRNRLRDAGLIQRGFGRGIWLPVDAEESSNE